MNLFVFLLAAQIAPVPLENVLAPGDSPGLADVTMIPSGSVVMEPNGDVVFGASLQGAVTSDGDSALIRWDSALDVFEVTVREGFVVDEVSNTRLTDARGFLDVGGLARGVHRSLQGSGVGTLWVTGSGGAPPALLSVGGAQCVGAPLGILQQGDGNTRALMNSTGAVGFKDCGGVVVGEPGSLVTQTFTDPPQGTVGSFTTAPLIEVLDDLGGVWLRGNTGCPACVGLADTNLWRVSTAGVELIWSSNAHTDLAPVVNISTPSLNSSGDFAAAAFLTPNLSTGTTAIIRVTAATGDVVVLTSEGDEIPSHVGRNLAFPPDQRRVFLADDGDVVFFAHVDNPAGQGVFKVGANGDLVTLAITGDAVDDLANGSTLTGIDGASLAVSRDAHVAVNGTLTRVSSLTAPVLLRTVGTARDTLASVLVGDQIVTLTDDTVFTVGSWLGPLFLSSLEQGFTGNGTPADGFTGSMSDVGVFAILLTSNTGTQHLVTVGVDPSAPPPPENTVTVDAFGPGAVRPFSDLTVSARVTVDVSETGTVTCNVITSGVHLAGPLPAS